MVTGEVQIGDQDLGMQMPSELHVFLDAVFSRKRLIILNVNSDKRNIVKGLHAYYDENGLGMCNLDGSSLGANDIRDEIEVVFDQGIPYSNRLKPSYIYKKC